MSLRERVIGAMAASIQQTPIYRDQDAYRETDYRKLAAWAFDAAIDTGLLQLVGVSSEFDIDELMKESDEENARLVRDLTSQVASNETMVGIVSEFRERAIAAEIRAKDTGLRLRDAVGRARKAEARVIELEYDIIAAEENDG